MGCSNSRQKSVEPGDCIICFSDSVDEYYMWPCGHGNVCVLCAQALNAESVGWARVNGHTMYFTRNQSLLRCPVCRSDGYHHRIFRV